jgi:hypothetical protein
VVDVADDDVVVDDVGVVVGVLVSVDVAVLVAVVEGVVSLHPAKLPYM